MTAPRPEQRLQMFGPILGRRTIAAWLEANFAQVLTDLRYEWDLTEDDLPTPVAYVPHEPDALDRWPTIAVTTGLTSTTSRTEHTDDGAIFATTYPFEVYSWVRAEHRGAVQDMRDLMGTAVKVALLGNRTFGNATVDMRLDEDTFEQSYSDLQQRKGDRWIAGTLSSFDLLVTEYLGPYGATLRPTVGRVTVTGEVQGTPFAVPTPFLPVPLIHPAFE